MKYSKDDIIEALRCCSLNGRNSCETCPLKEECEESPLESILAKYTLGVVTKLTQENMALTEQRDTFREYAYQMHAMIENIRVKENEGYEVSAAKAAAEMDMWRVVALTKKQLEDEIERLQEKLYAKKNS
jgi:phage terminase Nu1 subunit (DNA packaging protein)